MKDAFSACHPAVNFVFFVGAIGCGVVFQHPAYLAVSIAASFLYYLFLGRRKALKPIAFMLVIVICLAAVHPIFNTRGEHLLFRVFDRPYTQEALVYGTALAGVFLTMFLWFGCYNFVLTGDKFTSLFGNWIPSISLLLVMVLRMVPAFTKKTKQIIGARMSIGKGEDNKVREGMTVLGTLVSWALEGSIVTADSMRARGYGTAKRQSFLIYHMDKQDWFLLAAELLLLGGVIASACLGQANAVYIPTLKVASLSWGAVLYGVYVSIPLLINLKEAIVWHISRSRI